MTHARFSRRVRKRPIILLVISVTIGASITITRSALTLPLQLCCVSSSDADVFVQFQCFSSEAVHVGKHLTTLVQIVSEIQLYSTNVLLGTSLACITIRTFSRTCRGTTSPLSQISTFQRTPPFTSTRAARAPLSPDGRHANAHLSAVQKNESTHVNKLIPFSNLF